MKRNTLLLIAMSLFFLACEEERLPGDGGNVAAGGDVVPVKFNVELELGTETEYVPMTRAEESKILTQLRASHPYILMKLVNEGWYIDQIGKWDLSSSSFSDINVTGTTSFLPLSLELRPGTYRLAVFLNGGGLTQDENYKVGSRVTDAGTPDEEFPCLFTYTLNSKKPKEISHLPIPLLRSEIFSGYTEFSVNKNDDLHTGEPVRSFKVPLTRKVGQIQFLMKTTPDGRTGSILRTAYWLIAILKATPDKPFCEGLNALGLPYFNRNDPCTELGYYCSTLGVSSPEEGVDYWRTDAKGGQYQMPETGSTDGPFFWLADPTNTEGVSFSMENIRITGQSENYWYPYAGTVERTLIANQACAVAFQSSGVKTYPDPQSREEYLAINAQLATDNTGDVLNESDYLFPPYYIWNQSMFAEPLKE